MYRTALKHEAIALSPRSSFARTLLLIVTLLFASLVTTYLVVLNFAILPSLQQFNKVLAYEVRMLMTDETATGGRHAFGCASRFPSGNLP
ncbi:hypothetical protein ACLK17_20805 [Escherichia coli]